MTYTHDFEAFGEEVLRSDFMVAEMERRAQLVAKAARADAPYDPGSTDGTHYKDAFRVETTKHGGIHHDRAAGVVINDDEAAFFIEYGTVDTPKFRTLGRALDAAGE